VHVGKDTRQSKTFYRVCDANAALHLALHYDTSEQSVAAAQQSADRGPDGE